MCRRGMIIFIILIFLIIMGKCAPLGQSTKDCFRNWGGGTGAGLGCCGQTNQKICHVGPRALRKLEKDRHVVVIGIMGGIDEGHTLAA